MGKLRNYQKGFSVVEVILVLVIIGLISVVGYMVYENQNKASSNLTDTSMTKTSTSTTKKTQLVDPYAGWQTYSDSHLSLKYPSGWQAGTGADKYAAVSITAISPAFTSSAFTTTENPNAPVTIFLQLSTKSSTADCSNVPCAVTAVAPLNNSQLPNSVLALVNQTSGNGTKYSQYVVVSDSTKVGDTTINALKAGSSSIYAFGQPYYTPKDGGLTIAARVSNTAALQSDSHFKDLINLINSIKFN